MMITADELRRLLNYDPKTGVFTNRTFRGLRALEGAEAGNITSNGYIDVTIRKRKYKAHRLAWLYVYGEWPENNIDHINRIKTDNRISNLRDVTQAENGRNKSTHKNNTSGVTGVDYHKGQWRARIRVNRKSLHLGYYATMADAVASRKRAEERYGYAAANI